MRSRGGVVRIRISLVLLLVGVALLLVACGNGGSY
jgi:hypothetical protein